MTLVLEAVNSEYVSGRSGSMETVIVTAPVLTLPPELAVPPDLSVPALRFHYLVVQLHEKGWKQTKIASAIGCHQTLISDWQRADFAGRKKVSVEIILACMSGLKLHYDYFLADYKRLPIPEDRLGTVETPDGPRPAKPGEADAALFPIDLDRARDNRTRKEVEELRMEARERRARDAERDREAAAMRQQLAELTRAVTQLTGGAPKKAGSR